MPAALSVLGGSREDAYPSPVALHERSAKSLQLQDCKWTYVWQFWYHNS
jgi:hypothetical protein